MMKTHFFLGVLIFAFIGCGAQKNIKQTNNTPNANHTKDTIYLKRIEVINFLFANKKGGFNSKTNKYEEPRLSKYFFQFRGLGAIIWNTKFVDNLLGHCADFEKEETYSFGEIFSSEELSELKEQIAYFSVYRTIDESLIHNSINIVDDPKATAITFPLIINKKAIIYLTNKNNFEVLLVLIKKDENWSVLCRKPLYLVIEDPAVQPKK